MKNQPFTFEVAVKKIDAIGGKPLAVEALWDGDTQGWYLDMYVVVQKGRGVFANIESHHLANLSHGSDFRLFTGEVPPYPEALLATEIGKKLEAKYQLEFFFPSPIDPDDDCPSWTQKDQAINCADCEKLIIPTTSPYLPKDICYHCHLERERNQRIKEDQPHDDGINMYLFKDDNYENIGYCSRFESFPIAPFIGKLVEERKTKDAVCEVSLEPSDIVPLVEKLEHEIENLLETYEMPKLPKEMERFVTLNKSEFKGRTFELMSQFNKKHEMIGQLLSSYQTAVRAMEEGLSYRIVFKKGITYRDDSLLRFVHYVSKQNANWNVLKERYKGILSEKELSETTLKLEAFGCLERKGSDFRVTDLGKRII